jgi:hypothetical protein
MAAFAMAGWSLPKGFTMTKISVIRSIAMSSPGRSVD